MQVGDRLKVEAPFGTFTLRESRTSDLLFVGGGAGMAPMLGLLRSMAERGVDRKVTFYYGARAAAGPVLRRRSWRSCRSGCPSFTYVPALSEPAPTTTGTGSGLITDVVGRRESGLQGWTPTSAVRRRWSTRRSRR